MCPEGRRSWLPPASESSLWMCVLAGGDVGNQFPGSPLLLVSPVGDSGAKVASRFVDYQSKVSPL